MNINKILITGNVTADPEIRYTPNGKAVLSASLANKEYYTDAQGQEQESDDLRQSGGLGEAGRKFQQTR